MKYLSFGTWENEEENVTYDVEPLFTNIPLKETVNYVLDQIYVPNVLPQICSWLILKRLLMKLATEVTFTFNGFQYRNFKWKWTANKLAIHLLFISIWNLYITISIYTIFITDAGKMNLMQFFIHSKTTMKILNQQLNFSPSKFLDTQLTTVEGKYITKIHRK